MVRAKNAEATALGAAYLAGLATGYYSSIEEVALQWAPGRIFEPAMSPDQRAGLRARWNKAVGRAKSWSDT